MCKPQVKAETAKKLVLEFISITEEGIDDIEIQDEYLKLLFFCCLLIFLRSVSCKQCWSITQLIISS
jgi:predicted RNA polymerase sigma factor